MLVVPTILRSYRQVVVFLILFGFFALVTIRNDRRLEQLLSYRRAGAIVIVFLAIGYAIKVWRKDRQERLAARQFNQD